MNHALVALKAHETSRSMCLHGGEGIADISNSCRWSNELDGGLLVTTLEKEFKRLLSEHGQLIYLPEYAGGTRASPDAPSLGYLLHLTFVTYGLSSSPQALDVSCMDNIIPKLVSAILWDDLQSMIQIWTQQLKVVGKMLYAGERRLARQVFKNVENSKAIWVEILCT